MTAALKTALVDALNASTLQSGNVVSLTPWAADQEAIALGHDYEDTLYFDADRLAKAVRDHLRAKLATAILYACDGEGIICGVGPDEPLIIERTFDDEFLDRLIEGLAAGGSEG